MRTLREIAVEISQFWTRGDIPPPLMAELRRELNRQANNDLELLVWALCDGGARWEAHTTEFCINSMCYSTKRDANGLPVVHEVLRAAILKAKGNAG